MPTDPVCRMQVDDRTAAGKSEYQGKAYFFCSDSCKQQFDRNPERYVGEDEQAGGAHTWR